jgi:protein-disulfide isomerase
MTVSKTSVPAALARAVLAAAVCAACADAPSAAGQAPAPPSATSGQTSSPPGEVVAEVGGRRITLAEVDQKWQEFDAGEKARVAQMLYQNRRNMLDQLIGDVLIETAAKSAGVTSEAYLAQESTKRAAPVTEADIKQFFDQNQDRAQGRTLDQLRPAIKEFLDAQRKLQTRAQIVDDLKKKAGGVRVMLDPPRQTVEVAATDAVRGEATAPITIVEFSDYQ